MNFLPKLWRAFATMTATSNPVLFPVADSNTLNFDRLTIFDTAHLDAFSLESGQILRRDGSPHWALLFHFTSQGMHYGLWADRTPEAAPTNTSSAYLPSHGSSNLSSDTLKKTGVQVSDRVMGHTPVQNATWPDSPPEGYTLICSLDLPSHTITLLDVSLVLLFTHQYQPNYRLLGYNCRWLAKTVALALEQLAHRHARGPEWKRQEDLFFRKTRSVPLEKNRRVKKALYSIITNYRREVSYNILLRIEAEYKLLAPQ